MPLLTLLMSTFDHRIVIDGRPSQVLAAILCCVCVGACCFVTYLISWSILITVVPIIHHSYAAYSTNHSKYHVMPHNPLWWDYLSTPQGLRNVDLIKSTMRFCPIKSILIVYLLVHFALNETHLAYLLYLLHVQVVISHDVQQAMNSLSAIVRTEYIWPLSSSSWLSQSISFAVSQLTPFHPGWQLHFHVSRNSSQVPWLWHPFRHPAEWMQTTIYL